MTDKYYMEIAYKEALLAFEEGEIPVGAVIVCNNTIIAKAHNQTERLKDVTAHAEILAITSASNHIGCKYLNDCSIYVTLEPCSMCAGALEWAQISKIVFGAYDRNKGFSRLYPSPLNRRVEIIGGIEEEKCSAIVKDFFADKRT